MPTLEYFGHSAFRVRDDKHSVFIDPFLTGNPSCPVKPAELKSCDFILLTHGHADHFGDALELALKHKATIVATWELAQFCGSKGAKVHPMAAGGSHEFPFGRVKMVPAIHGCGGDPRPDGSVPPPNTPVGLVVQWGSKGQEKILYHAGDTALYSDMKLIAERFKLDVACLPIGDNFTMGIEDATQAVQWLNPKITVPIHYNTFDIIKADAQAFAFHLEKSGHKCRALKPGEKMEF